MFFIMDIEYVDILKICRQFRLLIWTLFIRQFVNPIGEEYIHMMDGCYHYFSQLRVSF